MKIALDYDNTYTRDPELWNMFCAAAIQRKHTVTIVTSRHPDTPVELLSMLPVVYCGFKAKREQFSADVWIDDDPLYICFDHGVTFQRGYPNHPQARQPRARSHGESGRDDRRDHERPVRREQGS